MCHYLLVFHVLSGNGSVLQSEERYVRLDNTQELVKIINQLKEEIRIRANEKPPFFTHVIVHQVLPL